jgi:hypothetical protein
LLAPVYWPRLLVRSKLRPIERQVVDALIDALPDSLAQIIREQMEVVNYVQRVRHDGLEIALYRMTWLGPSQWRNRYLPFCGEMKLARIELDLGNGMQVNVTAHCVNGYLFLLESTADLPPDAVARRTSCEVLVDLVSLDRLQ